jgi:hypothetical protein
MRVDNESLVEGEVDWLLLLLLLLFEERRGGEV